MNNPLSPLLAGFLCADKKQCPSPCRNGRSFSRTPILGPVFLPALNRAMARDKIDSRMHQPASNPLESVLVFTLMDGAVAEWLRIEVLKLLAGSVYAAGNPGVSE